ncbi:MAG: curli-like amyloid fiber formation chaperone CsgH [Pseudomonadota bacterium]
MRRRELIAALLGLSASLVGGTLAAEPEHLVAWITVAEEGGSSRFQAHASAVAATDVRYSLRVLRIGSGGQSVSSQSGRKRLAGSRAEATLSTVAVNLGPGDSYLVELRVTSKTGTEAHATLSSPPATAQ